MGEKMTIARVVIILLFALTFTMIGWAAPVVYASYTPADQVIEKHSFEAQDTTTQSDKHYVCFDRTVHKQSSGTAFTELYIVGEGNKRVEVESSSMQRFFQEGRTQVITPFTLPDNLREGTYRYLLVIRIELADGRVTRDFAFKSDPFQIEEGPATNTERPTSC